MISKNIREKKDKLEELLNQINNEWGEEDLIYRFYHQSFKVYRLQEYTQEMYKLFHEIGEIKHPERFNSYYDQIFSEGTYKKYDSSHNMRWTYETRPIVEAFWHSKHILEMMLKYGLEDQTKGSLPQGWATVLYLYNIR